MRCALLSVFFISFGGVARAQVLGPAATPAQTAHPSALPIPAVRIPTPRSATVDDYFGHRVSDRFRPLESIEAPPTKLWAEAQNARARTYFEALPARASIAAAYRRLRDVPKLSVPYHIGPHYVFTRNSGLQTQNVYYVRDSERGPAREFFDPNTLSKDGSTQAVSTSFSHDGSLMAYATSTGGEDWQTWHVRDVATGRDTRDLVRWSKYSTATWIGNRGFYYAGYDAPDGKNGTFAKTGVHKVWFHVLGTSQHADRLVSAATAHPNRFVGTAVSEDQRLVFLTSGAVGTTQFSWKPAAASDSAFAAFTGYEPNVDYNFIGNDGDRVYLLTNENAPRFRIVAVDLHDPAHRLEGIVGETGDVLQDASLIGNTFYLSYLHDAYSVTERVTTHGHPLGKIELPGIGSGGLPYARREDRFAYYSYTSYSQPSTSYRYDTLTGKSSVYYRPRTPFDSRRFVTEQVFATSKDGTRVPIFLTHRKNMRYDGSNPTLMYGYGGFDYSESPVYSADRALWLEMGGVYADVALRGGGEFGEAWHDAGRLAQKQHTFDDFIAAGQHLIDSHVTSTPKLAIDGGSNGGLLIGACLTQRPDLFGAAIVEHGLLDMLRYQDMTIGRAWIPEYGSATASEAQFETLFAYSPLQNVRSGSSYPPTLITTADHDDRVDPAHSYKFAAALQDAQAGPAPILLRVETNEGHFAGMTTDRAIAFYADVYAFLSKSLGFTPAV